MTRAHRIALYSPPIVGLLLALGWCVADRVLGTLGRKAQN